MKKLNLPKEEIIELYNSGYGCYKIAKKYGCSASSINNLLKSEGTDTKKNPNNYRKYKLNEDYFSVIDSEPKAYFLGLIYSDGCVSKTNLRLSLQENDEEILIKFLNEIKSDAKLYHISKRKTTHKNQKLISISNIKMVNDLYNLGVTQKKSLSVNFPTNEQVPEKYLSHFIRGVFDGDGSVFYYERVINGKKYI
jgi:intein-encoded DNA endonuclease-like protein